MFPFYLYPLKTPENLWFSGVFRGYKMGILARNGLRASVTRAYKVDISKISKFTGKHRC